MFDIDYIEYNPFGETTLDTLGVTRQGYIGKEKDVENSLGDHTSTELSDHTSTMFILSLSKGSVTTLRQSSVTTE
jgi:hypothetical protein